MRLTLTIWTKNCCTSVPDSCCCAIRTIQADIRGHIKSIKNPTSGRIVANSIGEVIIDENIKQPADCQILTR